jgi:endonuclease/exonuclease/phosphatase family metal-dependent hydrolase
MGSAYLKICEYNVENLFISMEYYNGRDLTEDSDSPLKEAEWRSFALAQFRARQKPIAKTWGVARAILDIDPDIVLLIEVGGQDSLENFNRYFLGERFTPYFIEGNSRRGIDLAFLVKKEFTWRVEAHSNREIPIDVRTLQGGVPARLSRDIAELRLFDGSGLALILLLTHLKSMISTAQDYRGKNVRTAEAFALAEKYRKLRATYPEVPVVLGGDFNSTLDSLELEPLRHTDLINFHDVLGSTPEARNSLVYFDYAGRAQPVVLDYILISPELVSRIVASKSLTYRYKGFYGISEELPTTVRERYQMPSDHYPLVLTLRMNHQKL